MAGETQSIGQKPPLTEHQTRALKFAFTVAGETQVDQPPALTPEQQDMITDNLPLVPYVARKLLKKWTINPEEFEEAMADGHLGLVKAAINFNAAEVSESATTSSNYFVISIKGEILKGLRTRYGRYDWVVEDGEEVMLDGIFKRKPSVLAALDTASSFDASLKEESDTSLHDTIADPRSLHNDVVTRVQFRVDVNNFLKKLPSREREIVIRRYVFEQSQSDIAQAVGLSQMSISRILKKIFPPATDETTAQAA